MSDPFSNQSDPFMAAGGSSAATVSFPNLGDTVTGVVTAIDQRDDTKPDGEVKKWPDGKPMAVFIFTLDTDDGPQALWVRGNMVTLDWRGRKKVFCGSAFVKVSAVCSFWSQWERS